MIVGLWGDFEYPKIMDHTDIGKSVENLIRKPRLHNIASPRIINYFYVPKK